MAGMIRQLVEVRRWTLRETFKGRVIREVGEGTLLHTGVIVASCVGLHKGSNCDWTLLHTGNCPLIGVTTWRTGVNTSTRDIISEQQLVDRTLCHTGTG